MLEDPADDQTVVDQRDELAGPVTAHSMRATFITRALENGCPFDRVQSDVGHKDPSTTKLYDHRGDNEEEAAAFFATY